MPTFGVTLSAWRHGDYLKQCTHTTNSHYTKPKNRQWDPYRPAILIKCVHTLSHNDLGSSQMGGHDCGLRTWSDYLDDNDCRLVSEACGIAPDMVLLSRKQTSEFINIHSPLMWKRDYVPVRRLPGNKRAYTIFWLRPEWIYPCWNVAHDGNVHVLHLENIINHKLNHTLKATVPDRKDGCFISWSASPGNWHHQNSIECIHASTGT